MPGKVVLIGHALSQVLQLTSALPLQLTLSEPLEQAKKPSRQLSPLTHLLLQKNWQALNRFVYYIANTLLTACRPD